MDTETKISRRSPVSGGRTRTEGGQSFVEFSLVVVFLVLLVAGVADLGRAFFSYLSLQDASQEGATYASAFPKHCSTITVRTRDAIRNFSSITVQVYYDDAMKCLDGTAVNGGPPTSSCQGKEVRVLVRQNDFNITTPFIGAVAGTQTIPITADSRNYVLRCGP